MNSDFEKLGMFYLGKEYDIETASRKQNLTLLESKDLTTHAVIIGMTGSGKTGLGIGMLEEAAIDKIPVIAIDPKGDLANIALTFPNLEPDDFRPWLDETQVINEGSTLDEQAQKIANRWKTGLADWGQDSARIQRLRDAAEVSIYTPGSNSGRQLALLSGFNAPNESIRNDSEAFTELINSTTTSLLSLLGIESDPVSGNEYVFISNILHEMWINNKDVDLPSLISLVQNPPFTRIGIMPVDTVFPAKERSNLALRINNLLASPRFQSWMQGEALDVSSLLHSSTGKPKVSVLSIAHLGDNERMFFVTTLLAEILSWMRRQPGTGSLRAILYIDELFGYMPPVANPPSKQLLLTLLKQARAYGLGLVLSTQNPVDLDYRGLSNAGLWFIGRLQTEQDKNRVMDGLASASGDKPFDKNLTGKMISSLGKRVFLMHSIYENTPQIFETRWAMSYLAGPMNRDQIKKLDTLLSLPQNQEQIPDTISVSSPPSDGSRNDRSSERPVISAEIPQVWLHNNQNSENTIWQPAIMGFATARFHNARLSVEESRDYTWLAHLEPDSTILDWRDAELVDIDMTSVSRDMPESGMYEELPSIAMNLRNYTVWSRDLARHVSSDSGITIFQSKKLKINSTSDETEGQFRARLQHVSKEALDTRIEAVRKKYSVRLAAAQEKVRKSVHQIEKREEHVGMAKQESFFSMGAAILGVLISGKKVSGTSINRVGTAVRKMSKSKERVGDLARAEENRESAENALEELEKRIMDELHVTEESFDALLEELDEVVVRPKRSDIQIRMLALAWLPGHS